MSDIEGVEVKCTVCGKRKRPVGRSVPPVIASDFCSPILGGRDGCEGYDQDPQAGWLFSGELWSESFGDFPLPEPSECYRLLEGDG